MQKIVLVLLIYLFFLVREDFSAFQPHHVRRSAHNVPPVMTVPFPSKLNHLVFSIPDVKVLRDEVLGQQKISVPSLASRLLLHVHMESTQGGAWDVWTCYEDFYITYLELTRTHSSVNVPVLVDFMQLLSEYRRGVGHNGMGTSFFLHPPARDQAAQLLDPHLTFLASLQVLNFLSQAQKQPSLSSASCLLALLTPAAPCVLPPPHLPTHPHPR
eukprot:gene33599-40645_t